MTDPPTTGPTVDRDRALATLVTAFSSDPVMRWILPDPVTYLATFPELAGLLGADAFATGTADVADDHAGVALWVAPDAETDDDAIAALLERSIDPSRAEVVYTMLGQVVDHHPTTPVWYLAFVGVDPASQGRGLGTDLLRVGLDRADRDGLPAYLEASTVRNRSLYERAGFEVIGEIRAGDSPPLWPMLRR